MVSSFIQVNATRRRRTLDRPAGDSSETDGEGKEHSHLAYDDDLKVAESAAANGRTAGRPRYDDDGVNSRTPPREKAGTLLDKSAASRKPAKPDCHSDGKPLLTHPPFFTSLAEPLLIAREPPPTSGTGTDPFSTKELRSQQQPETDGARGIVSDPPPYLGGKKSIDSWCRVPIPRPAEGPPVQQGIGRRHETSVPKASEQIEHSSQTDEQQPGPAASKQRWRQTWG
ncbi:hypothetical protein CMUS01_00735 [Colletotrichum musicola]|uniref:Uncharacterized protein n=1 Tax=Colletotrichum musicola TaxID=2175873 RepID=A0A8H6NYD1_9PEZI|nr:hypothetical protein CMUS01_00735 [Colletotrichum musicola]